MRDFLILAIILGATPLCFIRPYFGILMWTWVAYFNPHRFAWGAAYNFPVALLIGGATLAGVPFSKSLNRRIFTGPVILLLVLWGWFGITYIHASLDPILSTHILASRAELIRVSKILLMTFMVILLVTSREKLRYLFLVTAFSIGFFAIKGTIFISRTGGEFRVYGPRDSFIEDNNALGMAINMSIPLFYFLARDEQNRWVRYALRLALFCAIPAVLLTYSRGALLGLVVVLGMLVLRSKQKIVAGFLMVVCAWAVLAFAPGKWMARMGTLFHGNLDSSAELRLDAWRFSWDLAKSYPITGGGFKTFTPELFQHFSPQLGFAGPHSIYFQTLGDHGFVGLALFLLLLGTSFYSLLLVRRQARFLPSARWLIPYSLMLEVGLLAFMISGAFLELANFDLFYQFIASTALLRILYRQEVRRARLAEAQAVPEIPSVELVEA
jgi:putative inorganic carbon (HCO3(-)) transporter